MVASGHDTNNKQAPRRVSIPFIAGQWSLPERAQRLERQLEGFNPLHCGAVVASLHRSRRELSSLVSIPFIAGQWSLPWNSEDRTRGGQEVSIPFIAGQWSLQKTLVNALRKGLRFNPLHCGAVVASRSGAGVSRINSRRFNPLHCGAVVASGVGMGRRRRRVRVSIPFIAGQWSLPPGSAEPGRRGGCFNPLHCGAVVASTSSHRSLAARRGKFQSPSLRGSGRFGAQRCVSARCASTFQSPSLRGSGRFLEAFLLARLTRLFQSPSLRGSGRFIIALGDADEAMN